MEADIDLVCRSYYFVGKPWPAAGAEYSAPLAKGSVGLLVPPSTVTEFHDVPPDRIELGKDSIKAGPGVVKAGRQLKEEAAHVAAKEIADKPKVADECLGPVKPFDMSD